jgi:RimJ/RimL family protein N-acetyltransferase
VPDDVAELVAFWSEHREALSPYFVMPPNSRAWREVLPFGQNRWLTARSTSGALDAVAVLARIAGPPWCSAEVGVGVRPDRRGRGVGTEVLRAVFARELCKGISRIEALVAPSNASSVRMVAAAGMAFEGLSKSVLEIEGRRCDLGRWAVLGGLS